MAEDIMATIMNPLRPVNNTLVMADIAVKMTNKEYHTVGTDPKSNRKIVEVKSILLMHIYMTAHFPGFVQALQ